MRRLLLVFLFALASPAVFAAPKESVSAETLVKPEAILESHRVRLWNATPAAFRMKLEAPIKQLLVRADVKPKPNEPAIDLWSEAKQIAKPLASSPADIETIAMLIMMQAAKSAQDDLKDMLAHMKAKQMIRDCKGAQPCIRALAPSGDVTKAILDSEIDKMKGKLDSMSEMGETESLRLQMAMDRMSKMMSTLSNIMKKISDTSQSITQNLK